MDAQICMSGRIRLVKANGNVLGDLTWDKISQSWKRDVITDDLPVKDFSGSPSAIAIATEIYGS